LKNKIVNSKTGPINAFDKILGAGNRTGYNMHFRFKAHANHVQGIPYPLLIIHYEGLGDHFQNLPVHGNHHSPCRLNNAGNVFRTDLPGLPLFPGNCHNAPRIKPVNVAAADACPAIAHFPAAHHFRGFDGAGYRAKRGFNIYHNALSQARGRAKADAGDLQDSLFISFADYGANLCRSYIEADNHSVIRQRGPPLFCMNPGLSENRSLPVLGNGIQKRQA